jgi:hypothetical protein
MGPPFFPHGVAISAEVPADQVGAALLQMRDVARQMEPHWGLLPHEVPQVEQVPGSTCAVDGDAGVYEDSAKRRTPKRIGF